MNSRSKTKRARKGNTHSDCLVSLALEDELGEHAHGSKRLLAGGHDLVRWEEETIAT